MNVWDTFCIGKTMDQVHGTLVHVLSFPQSNELILIMAIILSRPPVTV